MTREEILSQLHAGECVVEFTKVNGEYRAMRCTLSESLMPPVFAHETNTDNPVDLPKTRPVNPAVISVWCTDRQAWRSFRVANVTAVHEVTE